MNPQNLKELRGQIDALDDQLIELLLKRIEISNTIMGTKPAGQVVDLEREAEIYRRYAEQLGGVSTPAKVGNLVRTLLSVSSLYPEAP